MVQVKRAYEPEEQQDGYRILVDRLWPRGIKKKDLHLDAWTKEVAPSTKLRAAFAHDPKRWARFQGRYRQELRSVEAKRALDAIAQRALKGNVTLLYSAKDEKHNNAVVLSHVLASRIKRAHRR